MDIFKKNIFKKKINKKLIVGCFLILLFQMSIAVSHTEKSFVSRNSFSSDKNASTTFFSGNSHDFEAILEKDTNRFPGAQIISSEMNYSYARLVVRSENEENESKTHLMSTGEKAYQMVNYERSQNWLDIMNMPRYGKGVKVALTGCGVYPHDDIKEKPDGTLRTMWYIDINWYSYWDPWPWRTTVYEASNKYINTESEWTTYSDYSHDTNKKVGVYDGADHGTPVTGALLKIAPYVKLIWVDFLDYGTSIDYFASAWGLELLDAWHDPDIVSASWGSMSHYSGWDDPINDLLADGKTVFIASSGRTGTSTIAYPARLSNVMSVGAVNTRDEPNEGVRASFSNYGSNLDVTAPGNTVRAQSEDGGYAEYDGTSFSAPIVAGEAAQVYQLLETIRGTKPSSSITKNYLKYHCDLGGMDTSSSDYDATYSRQNDYYGHGITDAWEAISYATEDDYEDSNSYGWSLHYLTQASSPRFDVLSYTGPSPYPSGTLRGRLYMLDSSGDKQVIYQWSAIGDQPIKFDYDYDRYYSYYTKRSNGYTLAYHDFYPVLQDSNNYIKVRLYGKYLQVYRMYQGTLTKLYEENVYSHTGWWCSDWQQVEISLFTYFDYYSWYLGMYVSRKAEGSQYTSSLITLGGPYSYGVTYMNGPIAIGFRGGWSSGNYGIAYWDGIKVSQIPTGGLL